MWYTNVCLQCVLEFYLRYNICINSMFLQNLGCWWWLFPLIEVILQNNVILLLRCSKTVLKVPQCCLVFQAHSCTLYPDPVSSELKFISYGWGTLMFRIPIFFLENRENKILYEAFSWVGKSMASLWLQKEVGGGSCEKITGTSQCVWQSLCQPAPRWTCCWTRLSPAGMMRAPLG